MEPIYPLFIADRDGWMYMVTGPEQLISFEQIDVEDGEYSGWDVEGHPVALVWDPTEGVKARVTHDCPHLDELKHAIVRYANLGPWDDQFAVPDQAHDVVQLFQAAEQHRDQASKKWAEQHGLIPRVKRILGRVLSRK